MLGAGVRGGRALLRYVEPFVGGVCNGQVRMIVLTFIKKAGDGSRQPTAQELELATIQGKAFYETVSKVSF